MDMIKSKITWHTKSHLTIKPNILFYYLADFSSTRNWAPHILESTLLTDGPIQTGSTFKLLLNTYIGTKELIYKIIQYNPPIQMTLQSETQNYTLSNKIRLRPDCSNTNHSILNHSLTIHFKSNNKLTGWLRKKIIQFYANQALKNIQRIPLSHSERIKHAPTLPNIFVIPFFLQCTQFGYIKMKRKAQPIPISGQGLKIVLTECTSGIGQDIAIELARTGAELIMINQNTTKANMLSQQLKTRFQCKVHSYITHFNTIQNTLKTARMIQNQFPSIDILINNTGKPPLSKQFSSQHSPPQHKKDIMKAVTQDREVTQECFEIHFATALLAPFAITQTLIPCLKNRHTTHPAKVINICSRQLYKHKIDLDDLQYKNGIFNNAKAYARAKRGLLDITQQLARIHNKHDIIFHALHPGLIQQDNSKKKLKAILRTSYQSADTAIWLALSQAADHTSGLFWFNRQIQPTELILKTKTHPSQQSELFARLDLLIKKIAKHNLTTESKTLETSFFE